MNEKKSFLLLIRFFLLNERAVPWSKYDPTATLPIHRKILFQMSAAFEICVSRSNFGFFGKLRILRKLQIL